MSWIKRRGQGASPNPSSAPPVQMYNPNQHSNLQSQWQQQELQPPATNWYNHTQPNQPPASFGQTNYPPQQEYWMQNFNQQRTENAYNDYSNAQYSQYDQTKQDYTKNNHQLDQTYFRNTPNHVEPPIQTQTDTMNWGWGDEDNSNIQNLPLQNTNSNQPPGDTFGGDDRWNWSVEDSNTNSNTKENLGVENRQEVLFPKMGKQAEKHVETVRRDDQKDNVAYGNLSLNQLPLLKPKSKSDTLTPQWSTESQVSQDSSDVLHTSESDKSHMLSRSSTISESPISGQDVNPELNQQELHLKQFPPSQEELPSNYYRQENYTTQHENKEVLSSVQDEPKMLKPHPTPPPPLAKNQTPPLLPPPIDDSANNYKRVGPLSHKTATKYAVENQQQNFYSSQPYYPNLNNPFTQTVNLETLPDNSEQPDSLPQPSHLKKVSSTKTIQQWPENNEIAPINDRNQYLETGQLSNNDYDQSVTENSDLLPPPSFPRLVLGQLEQSDANNQDEPPPGLSRLVLGETIANEPPVGLHRMVPGESSSPKVQTVVRPSNEIYQNYNRDDNNSDSSAIQVRSATIGGDTNRSETIGADLSPYNSSSADNTHVHSVPTAYNNNVRETNADGANNLDESLVSNPPVIDRRDSIEGEPQDTSTITNLVSSVRNLAIGDAAIDSAATTQSERQSRKLSRQESTDSEKEHESQRKVSKERSERRYPDKHDRYDRDKGRRRYTPSPDEYRKKYERRRYKEKRYDDDTDYYSDKEKMRKKDDRDRLADYEKKYSSLKRDKDKERGRRDHRSHREYAGRDPRRNDYYSRYGEEYDDQTRPSSRSDSMHDSYRQDRDRHRDRDKDRHRRNRDPFSYNMQQGYAYDPYHPYYQQYHYYENLRRTNPQAYAEWYRKYYQQSGMQQSYGPEDRASVHSGRSSANDELAKDRYTRQSYYSQASLNYYRDPNPQSVSGHYGLDESRPFDQTDTSYLEDTTIASQRLTPAKFSTAHIKASITSGHLVKIFPNYPLDGQKATIEIGNLHELLSNDDEYKELVEFPGPLVKGVTHKKTIIEYCESKIRNAICSREISDVDSYVLMWELLILLLRQNGMVVGTDVAELLMKDRKQEQSGRASVGSNTSSALGEAGNTPLSETNASSTSIVKDEAVTNKFREFLIYGSGKEALEWAMKHNLWGHAFFLASKLDKRTYANVMTRFANGIALNDPLQTLYQLLSGKVPVMCTADEKWGNWKPHLAMILSNTSSRPDVDSKAIATLGDTLLNRGNLYAAQFCYLMAHVGFGCYGNEEAKLVLLGANHNKSFLEFALNEAIHMTEVYEYAISLNDSLFVIPEFQPYKYVLATRLADRGLLEKALLYLEKVSYSILQNPSLVQLSLISQVCQLADRLKYCDPVEESFEGDLDTSRPDNSWLKDLKAIEEDYNQGLIRQESVESSHIEATQELSQPVYEQPLLDQENWQKTYVEQEYPQPWQNVHQQPLDYQKTQDHLDVGSGEQYQEPTLQYWPNNQPRWNETAGMENNDPPSLQDIQANNDYWKNANAQQEEVEKQPDEVTSTPQISLPNQGKHPSDENDNTFAAEHKPDSPAKNKSQPIQPSSGWFTKIFNVVSFRPKNQMHLPDDTNPSIVYDEKRKAWINKEEGDEGIVKAKLLPPPTMADMMPKMGPPAGMSHQSFNPIPTGPNHMNNNVQSNQYPNMVRQQEVVQQFTPVQQPQQQQPQQQQLQQQQPQQQQQQPAPSLTPNDDLGMPARSNQPNMFKLDKSRNMKKAYVDILNPGARNANVTSSINAPDNFGLPPTNGTHLNYFVPAPVNDPNAPMDFLSHGTTQHLTDNTQMSRWSSASSLSREVQFYMQPKPARR